MTVFSMTQGQGQGHEPFKVGNSAIFKSYLLPIYNGGWQMTTESYIIGAGFVILS